MVTTLQVFNGNFGKANPRSIGIRRINDASTWDARAFYEHRLGEAKQVAGHVLLIAWGYPSSGAQAIKRD
jgi:hypothetical protein